MNFFSIKYILYIVILFTSLHISCNDDQNRHIGIYLVTEDDHVISKGEGFFFCKDVVITAKHVIENGIKYAHKIKLKYSYNPYFIYEVTEIMDDDIEDLDVALIRVKRIEGICPVDELGIIMPSNFTNIYNTYFRMSSDIEPGFLVDIYATLHDEHVQEHSKILSVNTNMTVFKIRPLAHNLKGFSGTPVFNSNKEVLGIITKGHFNRFSKNRGPFCVVLTMCHIMKKMMEKYGIEIHEDKIEEINEIDNALIQLSDVDSIQEQIDICSVEFPASLMYSAIESICNKKLGSYSISFEDWKAQYQSFPMKILNNIPSRFIRTNSIRILISLDELLMYLTDNFEFISVIVIIFLFIYTIKK